VVKGPLRRIAPADQRKGAADSASASRAFTNPLMAGNCPCAPLLPGACYGIPGPEAES